MIKDKKITKIGIITLSLILLIGVTYAFFEYYMVSDNREIIAGDVWLNMDETDGFVTLTNIFPETKEKARARDDNTVTFTISGANTTTDSDIYYEILLNYGEIFDGKTRFDDNDLVFDLVEIGTGGTETYLLDAVSFDNLNKRIWVETISKNTTSYTKTYRLRVWLNENVIISDSEDYADYPATNYNQHYASIKVGVYGSFKETYADAIGTINYDGSQYGLNILPTPIYESGNIVVTSEVTSNNVPRFLGYSTTPGGEVVYQPGDVINRSDLVNNCLNLYMIKGEWDLYNEIETKFASNLTTADTNGTRFISGKVTNNYVWYSGKLWQVVGLNSDGTVKLMTRGNMTTLPYHLTSSNTDYSTSPIRNWLNNDFLSTINDDLIVDSVWNYTPNDVTDTTLTVTDKVGILRSNEYASTGASSGSFGNGYTWITLNAYYKNTYLYTVSTGNTLSYRNYPNNILGIRPVVNIISNTKIVNNDNKIDGTKENPYRLIGDTEIAQKNVELNTRISGEYIRFDDTLYRIVGVETISDNLLTKVTMGDYSKDKNVIYTQSSYNHSFGSSTSQRAFSTSYGIGVTLYGWMGTISTTYKNMIASQYDYDIVWYTGPTSGVSGDYTKSKTGTPVSATIGLGYFGEIFSSQFGDGYSNSRDIWLITIASSSSYTNYRVGTDGYLYTTYPYSNYGARPSFYLKPDVKIVSGSGTQYDPYEITQ